MLPSASFFSIFTKERSENMERQQKTDAFSRFHPIVNFAYFALVLGCTMTLTHPACQLIALIGAAAYAVTLCGTRGVDFCIKYAVPIVLITMLVNPAFNHAGCTILAYLPSGNPLTLESILYGVSSGCMLASVLLWFLCVNTSISSDKFVCLFGRIIPTLSLLLSMILRFLPKFKAQFKTVSNAQKCIGRDAESGGLLHRLKISIRIFSITVTWSLENAIETADSMKSRGYGLKGRTAYSIYTWEERDTQAVLWLAFCAFTIICGQLSDLLLWRYLPMIHGTRILPMTIFVLIVYLLLCLTPVMIHVHERRQWKNAK